MLSQTNWWVVEPEMCTHNCVLCVCVCGWGSWRSWLLEGQVNCWTYCGLWRLIGRPVSMCKYLRHRSEYQQLECSCGLGGGKPRCHQLRTLGSRGSNWADWDPSFWRRELYILVSVPTIGSFSWSAREGSRMRLLVFVQVLHMPVCVDECGWLCIQVNMYCIHVFMYVPAGNICYWLNTGAWSCGSLDLLMPYLATP